MEIKKIPNENVKEMSLKKISHKIIFFPPQMSKQCFISFCGVNITSSHEMKNQTISQGSKQQNYDWHIKRWDEQQWKREKKSNFYFQTRVRIAHWPIEMKTVDTSASINIACCPNSPSHSYGWNGFWMCYLSFSTFLLFFNSFVDNKGWKIYFPEDLISILDFAWAIRWEILKIILNFKKYSS